MPDTRRADDPAYLLAQIHATQSMVVALGFLVDRDAFRVAASNLIDLARTSALNNEHASDSYLRGLDDAESYLLADR